MTAGAGDTKMRNDRKKDQKSLTIGRTEQHGVANFIGPRPL